MNVKKIQLDNIFSWLSTGSFCMLVILQMLNRTPNFLIILIMSVSMIAYYLFIQHNENRCLHKNLFFVFGMTLYMIIVTIINKGGIGSIITVVAGLFVFLAIKEIKLEKKHFLFIGSILFIVDIYWIIRSPFMYNLYYEYERLSKPDIILNPNGVGKNLCYLGIFLFILMGQANNIKIKKSRWILMIFNLIAIYFVHARISMIVFSAFFVADYFVSKLQINQNKMYKRAYWGTVILEIFFPIIYVGMYICKIGINIQFFNMSEKSLFSGREEIWMNGFKGMHNLIDWIVGVGSKQNYWEGHPLNMHNNALHLLVVAGILGGLVFFICLYYFIFHRVEFVRKTLWQRQLLLFFMCIMIEGCTDITIFYNGYLMYIYAPLALACSNRYIKNNNLTYSETGKNCQKLRIE